MTFCIIKKYFIVLYWHRASCRRQKTLQRWSSPPNTHTGRSLSRYAFSPWLPSRSEEFWISRGVLDVVFGRLFFDRRTRRRSFCCTRRWEWGRWIGGGHCSGTGPSGTRPMRSNNSLKRCRIYHTCKLAQARPSWPVPRGPFWWCNWRPEEGHRSCVKYGNLIRNCKHFV